MLKLFTISRDKLYEAEAVYENDEITVLKGSRINLTPGPKFKPSAVIEECLNDKSLVGGDGVLKRDVTFKSLSTAASFVTGRISNGMIIWKTEDGRYVRYTLKDK